MLRVRDLHKRFGDVVALDGVDLDVAPGEMVGFLGPNGAGKTTTMRAIMRLVDIDAGTVTWNGAPIDDRVRSTFGYMPAERGMYPRMRVGEHLAYYARLSGFSRGRAERAAEEWMERLGLTARRDSEVQALSSGNQQRVQLALALLTDPDLLVLDEPFSGLDPIAVETLGAVLRERVSDGAALLLSSHQLDLVADVCSAVSIVNDGSIVVRGDVAEIRRAAPIRYVTVDFADAAHWVPAVPGAVVHRRSASSVTIEVPAETAPELVLADAVRSGRVAGFDYAPPDLSEVFISAVGGDA
jgi:ABC-2 type transport system ATP-binding protein